MLLFRNAKTGEIVVGSEDRVEQCHYAAVITRVEEELDNELTGGWKIIEVSLCGFLLRVHRGSHYFTDGSEIRSPVPLVPAPIPFPTTLSRCSKVACYRRLPH